MATFIAKVICQIIEFVERLSALPAMERPRFNANIRFTATAFVAKVICQIVEFVERLSAFLAIVTHEYLLGLS